MKISLTQVVLLSTALAIPFNGIRGQSSKPGLATNEGAPRTSGAPPAPERHIPFRPRPNGTEWPVSSLPPP